MPIFTFQGFRIFLLFGFLLCAVVYTVHQLMYSRNWHVPLEVVIYPIDTDGHERTKDYIDNLSTRHFRDIEQWFVRESRRYEMINPNPVSVTLGKRIDVLPPDLPDSNNPVSNMLWGVRLRWWAYRNTPDEQSNLSRVRVFVLYHDISAGVLPSSLGLQRGLLGLINVYAVTKYDSRNNVVIAHEILHTVGAVDKYRSDGNPMFPLGYANPDRVPLYPQRSAEIMAGRIPTSRFRSHMAKNLKSTIISPQTAREINWAN